jgi:hypothetical protein
MQAIIAIVAVAAVGMVLTFRAWRGIGRPKPAGRQRSRRGPAANTTESREPDVS